MPTPVQRQRRTLPAAAAATVLVVLALLVPAPAGAVITNQMLSGVAGATQIKGPDGLIVSGMTSASSLSTQETGRVSTNTLADANVAGLLAVDALTTRVATSAITGGKQINSVARVANLNLLGGVVKATAVTTYSSVSIVNGIATPKGGTQFADLVVAGQALPVNVPKNFTINVPNVAKVVLNETVGANTSDATAQVISSGVRITLLSAIGSHPAGTTVLVTPTSAGATTPGTPLGAAVGGTGYATRVLANVGGVVKVTSGPTARASMPPGGTGGKDVTNSTLGVNVPKVLSTGIVSNTVNGSRASEASRSTVTSKIAAVNVLDGLIKADVISGRAQAQKTASGPVQLTPVASYVNLVIGGKPIPAAVPPNTVLDVAGLGKVTLNEQVKTATGVTIRALVVRIGTAGLGLPVGSTIELGVANAWVGSAA